MLCYDGQVHTGADASQRGLRQLTFPYLIQVLRREHREEPQI